MSRLNVISRWRKENGGGKYPKSFCNDAFSMSGERSFV